MLLKTLRHLVHTDLKGPKIKQILNFNAKIKNIWTRTVRLHMVGSRNNKRVLLTVTNIQIVTILAMAMKMANFLT